MAEVQNGKAVVWGITSDGTPIKIGGYICILESTKIVHKYETEAIKNEVGHDVSLIATNAHKEMDVMFVPSGASISDAYASAVFLPPNAQVVLSGFKVNPGPTTDVDLNGKWLRVGDQTLTLSHKEGKMDLKLRQYDDSTLNDSLCTTASS